jgi:hypothetical protein
VSPVNVFQVIHFQALSGSDIDHATKASCTSRGCCIHNELSCAIRIPRLPYTHIVLLLPFWLFGTFQRGLNSVTYLDPPFPFPSAPRMASGAPSCPIVPFRDFAVPSLRHHGCILNLSTAIWYANGTDGYLLSMISIKHMKACKDSQKHYCNRIHMFSQPILRHETSSIVSLILGTPLYVVSDSFRWP